MSESKQQRTTVRLSPEVHQKLHEHKEKTYRGSIIKSIEWLVLRYADYDIQRTTGEIKRGDNEL
jgi:predicted DNA-binding protein